MQQIYLISLSVKEVRYITVSHWR